MSLPDYITVNEDYSHTVKLTRNYAFDGERRDTITLREPTAGEQKKYLPKANASAAEATSQEMRMLSDLANGVPPEAWDRLAIRDYQRIQRAFSAFLESDPAT